MQNACLLFYIVSQVFQVYTSYKKLRDTTSPFVSSCFILAFIYISRYDFLQVFRTSFTIIKLKIFVTISPFLMDSSKLLQPLNSQNPLSVTNFFLMIPHLNCQTQLPKQPFLCRKIYLVTRDNSTYLNHQTIIYSIFFIPAMLKMALKQYCYSSFLSHHPVDKIIIVRTPQPPDSS